MRPALATLLLVPLALVAAACGGAGDETTDTRLEDVPPLAPAGRVGEVVTLELEENPTTGYRWVPTTVPAALRYLGRDYVPDEPQVEGSGGTARFRFRALAAGATAVEFTSRGPDGPDDPPRRASVSVVIAP
ncbi:MAG: protease inhibitor I42 family protein [Thermoleophilia bacterium]|nr:protease inhibitor I42 family protein [Thermoleophilia bacterium]